MMDDLSERISNIECGSLTAALDERFDTTTKQLTELQKQVAANQNDKQLCDFSMRFDEYNQRFSTLEGDALEEAMENRKSLGEFTAHAKQQDERLQKLQINSQTANEIENDTTLDQATAYVQLDKRLDGFERHFDGLETRTHDTILHTEKQRNDLTRLEEFVKQVNNRGECLEERLTDTRDWVNRIENTSRSDDKDIVYRAKLLSSKMESSMSHVSQRLKAFQEEIGNFGARQQLQLRRPISLADEIRQMRCRVVQLSPSEEDKRELSYLFQTVLEHSAVSAGSCPQAVAANTVPTCPAGSTSANSSAEALAAFLAEQVDQTGMCLQEDGNEAKDQNCSHTLKRLRDPMCEGGGVICEDAGTSVDESNDVIEVSQPLEQHRRSGRASLGKKDHGDDFISWERVREEKRATSGAEKARIDGKVTRRRKRMRRE